MHPAVSSAFLGRRIHSLMGLWLVLYLIEHLLVNSQAALWISTDGSGFVRMVNSLESLPYLHVVEVIFIGIPIVIHGVWGVKRALSSRVNSLPSTGKKPSLKYERNIAYTLQRISSWVLLFGIIGHVAQMRFIDQPQKELINGQEKSVVMVTKDDGLYPLAQRLGVTLEDAGADNLRAIADTPGTAMLLMVRNTFKSPLMVTLYTIFLLAAAFHAFNGFWTFLITWGALLSYRSQKAMIPVCISGIAILSFLGLAAIWGSYYVS